MPALLMEKYSLNYLILPNIKVIKSREDFKKIFGFPAPEPNFNIPAKYWYDSDLLAKKNSGVPLESYYTYTTIFDGFGGLLVDTKRKDADERIVFPRVREIDVTTNDAISVNLNIEESHSPTMDLKGTVPIPHRGLFENEGLIKIDPFHDYEVVNLDLWHKNTPSPQVDKKTLDDINTRITEIYTMVKYLYERNV